VVRAIIVTVQLEFEEYPPIDVKMGVFVFMSALKCNVKELINK
jgi:hypothetical protein